MATKAKKKGILERLAEFLFGTPQPKRKSARKKTSKKSTSKRKRSKAKVSNTNISSNRKKKANSENKRFQNHFRKFHDKKTTGHPSYVYGETRKEYNFIGITSSPRTNGVDNIPLLKNPEPNSTGKAYLRPTPDTINKGVRNEKLKGWSFCDEDKKKVRHIIEAHEKKKQ